MLRTASVFLTLALAVASAKSYTVKVFQPAYHLHGHIHVYTPQTTVETQLGKTSILNTYGYRRIETHFPWEK